MGNLNTILDKKSLSSVLSYISTKISSVISNISRVTLHAELERAKPIILPGFIFQKSFNWVIENIRSVHYVNIPPSNQNTTSKPILHNDMFEFLPKDIIVLSACNGLICCVNRSDSQFPPKETLYICNPTNKQWISLDCPDYDKIHSIVLAFDPYKHPIDVSTKFSLVTVRHLENENKHEGDEVQPSYYLETENKHEGDEVQPSYKVTFDVYSSETKSWNNKSNEISFKLDDIIVQGTYIGGIIYWITDSSDKIFTWDLEKERSSVIQTPVPPTEFRVPPAACIGEWKGTPHYVMITEKGIHVWHLGYDHDEPKWGLMFRKSLEEIECDNCRLLSNLEFVERTGMLLPKRWIDPLNFNDGVVFMKVADYIYLYDIEKNLAVETIFLADLMTTSLHRRPNVFPHSSSLVPLEERDGPVLGCTDE